MSSASKTRCAGFTLIELMIVLVLLGLIFAKASVVMSNTSTMVHDESSRITAEDNARTVLDRVALAVLSCDRDSLVPILTPGHSTGITFVVSFGIENGEVVWSPQREISVMGAERNQLVWREAPGLPEERRAVWSNLVRPYLEGELENGVDDNGNGLVDEEGMTFSIDGNEVTIRLSLGSVDNGAGEPVTTTLETVVTCRNNPVNGPTP